MTGYAEPILVLDRKPVAPRLSDQCRNGLAPQNTISNAGELGVGSPKKRRKTPYWRQQLRHHIRPAAQRLGHPKGHWLAHISQNLLDSSRVTGAELKVMEELMRHSTIRVILDTYTQAVTSEKARCANCRGVVFRRE